MNLKVHFTAPAVIAMLFAAQVAMNLQLRQWQPDSTEPAGEKIYKVSPDLFKTLSFGHATTGIDWLWIKSLLDSAISHVQPGTHPAVYYSLDLATDLDPAFFEVYTAGANLISVIRNDGPGARDLLLKGERFRKEELPRYPEEFVRKYWSAAWELPMLLAYVYLFELNDISSASGAFREAAALPGSPEYLDSLARRFERPGGEYEVGGRLLNFLIQGAEKKGDAEALKGLEEKRRSLFLGQYLFHLRAAFQKFLGEQKGYRQSLSLSDAQMETYWRRFLRETDTSTSDPFGGVVSLDNHGQIVSSTPHIRVFGLE